MPLAGNLRASKNNLIFSECPKLPGDVILEICKHVPLRDRLATSLTCHAFAHLCLSVADDIPVVPAVNAARIFMESTNRYVKKIVFAALVFDEGYSAFCRILLAQDRCGMHRVGYCDCFFWMALIRALRKADMRAVNMLLPLAHYMEFPHDWKTPSPWAEALYAAVKTGYHDVCERLLDIVGRCEEISVFWGFRTLYQVMLHALQGLLNASYRSQCAEQCRSVSLFG